MGPRAGSFVKALQHVRRVLLARKLTPLAVDGVWGTAFEAKALRRKILDRLDTFSPAAVRSFVPQCAANEDYARMIALALLSGESEGQLLAYSALGWGRIDERAIHEVLRAGKALPAVRRVLNQLTPDPSPEMDAIDAYVRAVRTMLGEFSASRSHAEGILHWDDWDISTCRPADPALAELILDRPEDAERIADIVTRHHIGRGTEVAALLDGSAPSLASGAL